MKRPSSKLGYFMDLGEPFFVRTAMGPEPFDGPQDNHLANVKVQLSIGLSQGMGERKALDNFLITLGLQC